MKEQALYYCEYQVNAAVVLCADAILDMYFIFCGFHLLYSAYMCVHIPSSTMLVSLTSSQDNWHPEVSFEAPLYFAIHTHSIPYSLAP